MQIDDNEVSFDRTNAFQLFAAFTGDLERTAHALNISPVALLRVADAEGWMRKLEPIIALKKSNKPGDVERGINRALNYVQAFRMRIFIERVINRLTGFSPEELDEYIFTAHEDKTGDKYSKLTTRAIADLTSALEKAHSLTYLALGDTTGDRNRRQEQATDDGSVGQLHMAIASAMAREGASTTPRSLLFDAQLSAADEAAKREAGKPEPSRYNSDDH